LIDFYLCVYDRTVSNIPHLTKTLHQSYNDGMVNPEVVCHPSMAKTTVMHAHYVIAMLNLDGHMIIWGGLFAHGDRSTGLMKVGNCLNSLLL
jgi:hypothetical protein